MRGEQDRQAIVNGGHSPIDAVAGVQRKSTMSLGPLVGRRKTILNTDDLGVQEQ